MTVLPVIERELRSQARLRFTYVMRVLAATALLLVCVYFWAFHGFSARLGPILFVQLNLALLSYIWVLVPMLAADSISRERREGTLGLLFLTPLSAREIVLSKGLAHGLRALTLWFAALPVVTLSFLLGGVNWKEVLFSGMVNFSSICWALAAALLASSLAKARLRAMLLAAGLAGCFAIGLICVVGVTTLLAVYSDKSFIKFSQLPIAHAPSLTDWADMILITGFVGITGMEGWWGKMFGVLTPSTQRACLLAQLETAALSVLFLYAIILFAAWNTRRVWQEEPPSARRVQLESIFLTPVVGVSFFRRWLRRKLERNPIGWLEQRTWSGRLVTWGWFAVMISFYSAVFEFPNSYRRLADLQSSMAWGLILLVAVCASGSFQRERETRVLELLLVSPMTVGRIIEGRLRGLWGQFLPALALLLGVWIYLAQLFISRADFNLIPFVCGAYVTLPIVGLHYSLLRAHFLSAFLSTLFVGLLLPVALGFVLQVVIQVLLWSDDYESPMRWLYLALRATLASPFAVNFMQAAVAIIVGTKLYRNLVQRNFAYVKNPN